MRHGTRHALAPHPMAWIYTAAWPVFAPPLTLSRARGFIPAAFLTTILLLVLCAALAFAISALTGIAWQTMVLATAPGSVTEMALTAKILDEGVAVVTAYHVVRIFVIIPLAPLIFAVTARIAKLRSS